MASFLEFEKAINCNSTERKLGQANNKNRYTIIYTIHGMSIFIIKVFKPEVRVFLQLECIDSNDNKDWEITNLTNDIVRNILSYINDLYPDFTYDLNKILV